MDKNVKILTANIAHGLRFGEFSIVDEKSLISVAREFDADVVCLQEVDYKKERSSNLDQMEILRVHGNFPYARFFPALIGEPGDRSSFRMPTADEVASPPANSYGLGILSRYPITEVKTLQLSGSRLALPMPFIVDGRTRWRAVPDEPRIAVRVTIDSPLGSVDVVTTHLSFIQTRAMSQLLLLKQLLQARPAILAGDLNLSPSISKRITKFEHAVLAPTYPKPQPRAQLDHILISEHFLCNQSGATELSISDHFAAFADLSRK
jgi:endonuclease/exonuclease/phosphatase family metal-dependent hydrolase